MPTEPTSPIDILFSLVGAPNRLEIVDDALKARDDARAELAAARASAFGANVAEATSLQAMREQYIRHVLVLTGNNKTRAAKILGIDRRTLYRHVDLAKKRAKEQQP